DTTTWQELRRLQGHKGEVPAVAFGPDGRLASASWDGTIKVWEANTGKELLTLTGHQGQLYSVAWNPADGRLLASVGEKDATLRIWDTLTGQEKHRLQAGQGALYGVAWSRDGQMLATTGAQGSVKLWEATTGQEVRTLLSGKHSPQAFAVAFSPDNQTVVCA